MKAIAHDGYGPPDDLELRDVDKPSIDENGVLLRVRAAAANPFDWHLMRGEPSFLRMMGGRNPVGRTPGGDVAGKVVAVGARVAGMRPGDEVLGVARGSFAEYARSSEKTLVAKPRSITYEQAAAIPVAGCTALQAVRDHGRLQPGQSVLINGAAGGVGTFAVQIAKALGGRVTGVCSTRNLELVASLGADHIIDYTADDFTRGPSRYDLIVQLAGNRTLAELRSALARDGHIVVVGGGTGRDVDQSDGLWEVMSLMFRGMVLSRYVRPRALMFFASIRKSDLAFLTDLVEKRELSPVIDRSYPLANAADAIRHLETGHARGKVIVTV